MKRVKHEIEEISDAVRQVTVIGKHRAEILIECVDHKEYEERMVLIKTQIPQL